MILREKGNKSLIALLIFIIGLLISGYFCISQLEFKFFIGFTFFWSLGCSLLHLHRVRKCPNCNKVMKMDLSIGFPPEYYNCSDCDVQVKTYVKRDLSL